MAGKYLTVLVGCFLLVGCLIGISVLVFGPLSDDNLAQDSYTTFHRDHSSFDDWKSKQTVHSRNSPKKAHNESEMSESTNTFQILFSKNNSVNHSGRPSLSQAIPPNILLPNKRTINPSTVTQNGSTQKPSSTQTPEIVYDINTSTSKSVKLGVVRPDGAQYWRPIIPTGPHGHLNRKQLPPSTEYQVPPSGNSGVGPYATSTTSYNSAATGTPASTDTPTEHNYNSVPLNIQTEGNDEMVDEEDDDEETEEGFSEDQFGFFENEEETVTGTGDEDNSSLINFAAMLEQISSLYTQGLPNLQRVFQFLNETVSKENTRGLLTQLNNLYSRPEILEASSLGSELFSGRNSYESSLTAFVFMSFGVFLLNQIHNLIGGTGKISADGSEARDFHNPLEMTKLNILFEPPPEEMNGLPEDGNATDSMTMRMADFDSTNNLSYLSSNSSAMNSSYVNNMFRALLNLVNAYTKDPQVLECIWSSYCADLDRTSAQDGLYGIAARINSIGLRLIMHQISSELTLDVMLRSLLGWDGLPCAKMFPVCHVNSSSMVLQFKDAEYNLEQTPRPERNTNQNEGN